MPTDHHLGCSPLLRAQGVDPVGSAVTRTSFLLVDVPLPWPADIGDIEHLAPVHRAVREASAAGRPWRVQATVPGPQGPARIVAHVLPEGAFDRYRRFTLEVPAAEVVDAARALVEDPAGSGATETPDLDDLLVCTHGKRDRCCGSAGTSLWTDLAGSDVAARPDLHLVRTSHTGGHRFAPTALHLPTGTMWAWLDPARVTRLLDRAEPFADLAPHHRGSTALATPAEQVVDREIMATLGWAWLEHRRTSRVVDGAGTDVVVEVDHVAPDGSEGRWTAQVREVGRSPVPACGLPLDAATKDAPVLEIIGGGLVHHPHPGTTP